jgi:hypothetical protein
MTAEILKIPCSNKDCQKIHDVKWDNGVWPDYDKFILVADWIYCVECWDEIEKDLYPGV